MGRRVSRVRAHSRHRADGARLEHLVPRELEEASAHRRASRLVDVHERDRLVGGLALRAFRAHGHARDQPARRHLASLLLESRVLLGSTHRRLAAGIRPKRLGAAQAEAATLQFQSPAPAPAPATAPKRRGGVIRG